MKARFVKVESSPTVSGVCVSVLNLHWMAQRSPSKVSATRSIPSSVFGRLIFDLTAGGSSSFALHTCFNFVLYSEWVVR
ncbi:MAG TPA: hypothetical protein PKJ37_01915 [Acidobacteriota bacterium]|nr:hypothetical protein [Acidobacteriota bacterium]HNT16638.1 hypothetical protein [Acidobacteriota bacterium]